MIALDTSVAVPSVLPWHEAHAVCHRRARGASVAAHALVEIYSVVTRLPAPHRFGTRVLVPSDLLSRAFVDRLADAEVRGGATYDGIVALTTAEHGAQLVTRDLRAAATYEALGVSFELVSG
jgi:hypothetical protein